MIRPKKPLLFVFLPLMAIVSYIAVVYELSLIYAAFSLLGTMLALAVLLSWLGLRGLEAARSHPAEVMAGAPFDVEVTIRNRTPALSSMFFTVEDAIQRDHEARPRATAILALEPAEVAAFTFRALIRRRGEYRFADVRLSSRFPFGALEKRATLPAKSALIVLPRPGRLTRDIVNEQSAPHAERPVPLRGGSGEFHGVRPFQPGDNPRWIHWATSARKGGTWTREFEREIDRRLLIVLAACEPFERAVTMCATLADHYIRRHYQVACAAGRAWIPFGTGPDHLKRILRALAPVTPDAQPRWDPREVRGTQIAVVGDGPPAGLAPLGVSLTLISPLHPALQEVPIDEGP